LIIKETSDVIRATPSAKKSILADSERAAAFEDKWISALHELGDHQDTALLLAMHYVKRGRWNDAVVTAAGMAEGMEPGSWTSVYLTVLRGAATPRIVRKIRPATRVQLYNAIGLCHSRLGDHKAALDWFRRLRSYARRIGNAWGIGQSHIHLGVVFVDLGESERARRCFRSTIQHARRYRDRHLLGAALSNLAQVTDDFEAADRFIQESIAVKLSSGDASDLAATYLAAARLYALRGDVEQAIDGFSNAAALAEQFDMRHMRALALHNLGSAHYNVGARSSALHAYAKSDRIAKSEGFTDVQLLAVQGMASVLFDLGRFAEAERAGRRLLDLARPRRDTQAEISALHGIGISLTAVGRKSDGRRRLNQALRRARVITDCEWIVRCVVDRTRPCTNGTYGGPDTGDLRKAARAEERRGDFGVAGELWRRLAVAGEEIDDATKQMAFDHSIRCLKRAKHSPPHALAATLRDLYLWLWQSSDYAAGVATLRELENISAKGGLRTEHLSAMAQRAMCLQVLGDVSTAESIHRKTVRIARRLKDQAQLGTCLHNHGEALRNLGKHRKAIELFREAEAIAQRSGVIEDEIASAHSRALALQDAGNTSEAGKVLEACRGHAQRHSVWGEYIRAWSRGRVGLAERRYRRALAEAKRRKLPARQPRIALNLAQLLSSAGRHRPALRILSLYGSSFARMPDGHKYCEMLAELQEECGELDAAADTLSVAASIAERIGATSEVVHFLCLRADALRRCRRFKAARVTVNGATKLARTPDDRTRVLMEKLQLLLPTNDDATAQATYNEIVALAGKHGLPDVLIEVHLAIATHGWSGPRSSRLSAMKAYVLAFLHACSDDEDSASDLVSDILMTLTDTEKAPSEAQFRSLCRDLRNWAASDLKISAETLNALMYPFNLARELLPVANDPRRFRQLLRSASRNNRLLDRSAIDED
jgi:tetratricopeptide (TPR) repeat protein